MLGFLGEKADAWLDYVLLDPFEEHGLLGRLKAWRLRKRVITVDKRFAAVGAGVLTYRLHQGEATSWWLTLPRSEVTLRHSAVRAFPWKQACL